MSETTRPNQWMRWATAVLAVATLLSYAGLALFIWLGHATVPEIFLWFGITLFASRWGRQTLNSRANR
jgi:hypothetical protein